MATGWSFSANFLIILFTSFLNFPNLSTLEIDIGIGVGIGIGGDNDTITPQAPPPAPLPSPSPSPAPLPSPAAAPAPLPSAFPNLKQYRAYLVIQSFKQTLTCDPLNITSTWLGTRPCNYTGFSCDFPPNSPSTPTIAAVDFNDYHLCAPTLAGFLDALPDLALFHANSNRFASTVPSLSSLPFLYELDLSNNLLSGAFPTAVLALSNLTFLDLRFNQFNGAVPASLFSLNTDVLFINNNLITGALPATVFSRGAYLTLANNGFTGGIPRSICNSSSTLIELLLLGNSLSGCLPYEAGLLSQATVFDIGFNRITGPIPLSFGCLRKVEQLNLAGNLLYGRVPDILCSLAAGPLGKLENLSLSGNYFTSLGHSCWGLVKSGVLDVKGNCLPGWPEQRPAAECWAFLVQPKYCPYLPYIPCELPSWWSWWGGGRFPFFPFFRPAKPVAPPREYVTYSAVNRRHRR